MELKISKFLRILLRTGHTQRFFVVLVKVTGVPCSLALGDERSIHLHRRLKWDSLYTLHTGTVLNNYVYIHRNLSIATARATAMYSSFTQAIQHLGSLITEIAASLTAF